MRTIIFSISLQVPFITYPLGSPADNKWQGSFFNSQTYVLNSPNVNTHSPMYVRSGATYYPVNNQSFPFFLEFIPITTTGPFNNQLCNALPNLPPGNPNPAFMEHVVQDSVPYPVFPTETSWQNKEKVFKQLKETPQLMNNSPILQSFYATALGGSMQAFDSTDVSLYYYNYTQAALQNASVSPPLAVSLERQLHKKTCFLIKKLLSLQKRLKSANTKI